MNTDLTPKALVEALKGTQGIVLQVKNHLSVKGIEAAWSTIDHAIKNPEEHFACFDPKDAKAVRDAYIEETEAPLDIGENKLIAAVTRGEPWAVRYLLDRKGKRRGYDAAAAIKLESDDPLNINLSGDMMDAKELEGSGEVEVGGGQG